MRGGSCGLGRSVGLGFVLGDMYSGGGGEEGEEGTSPYWESVECPGTLCLVGDDGNKVVWSGHKDGRIRCWKMGVNGDGFREEVSWLAHRAPVLSMVITSYGDLWTGSENGAIKIWPWEAIEKSLMVTIEERHMSALLIERSYIDLRSQVVLNGPGCGIFASDVKHMFSDRCAGRVWSASYISYALWDARTRELLKMFNIDGIVENMSSIQGPILDDEVRMRVASVSKKEKTQSSVSFFQRSRNAIIGAADAVLRAATKGAFIDDYRRTEALVVAVDGSIWIGCANGVLILWDRNGNRLQDFQYHQSPVHCLCTYGSRIWVGYASGVVQVLDLNGNLLGEWVAHNSPVVDLTIGSGYVFTLANHGGIRGWNIKSPGPVDGLIRSELARNDFIYTKLENVKILAGTWNVGQGRATHDSFICWLGSAAVNVEIVVVGLQEVEMGAGFLAMSAAKESMQVGLDGSSVGQWWLEMIGKTLDEGLSFVRLGSRQLAGLLIAVWVRNSIRSYVGDVDAAAVPCGFGRAIGNKGAVGLRMRVYGRTMCFVNCHFAAHLEAIGRRNADFDHVYRSMVFSRSTTLFSGNAGPSSTIQTPRGANGSGINSTEGMPELSEADMVVFLGRGTN
ncbi:hypothetical protein Leryth_018474 [Lithospermum erythrorhizon]|nr:hypothetical protein Leryth_018474 [Lithospermum erythrorhizon]